MPEHQISSWFWTFVGAFGTAFGRLIKQWVRSQFKNLFLMSFVKFQDFYWDEDGGPVEFYVGRLRSIVFSTNNDLDISTSIFYLGV